MLTASLSTKLVKFEHWSDLQAWVFNRLTFCNERNPDMIWEQVIDEVYQVQKQHEHLRPIDVVK
jgi:hypothetical protein